MLSEFGIKKILKFVPRTFVSYDGTIMQGSKAEVIGVSPATMLNMKKLVEVKHNEAVYYTHAANEKWLRDLLVKRAKAATKAIKKTIKLTEELQAEADNPGKPARKKNGQFAKKKAPKRNKPKKNRKSKKASAKNPPYAEARLAT